MLNTSTGAMAHARLSDSSRQCCRVGVRSGGAHQATCACTCVLVQRQRRYLTNVRRPRKLKQRCSARGASSVRCSTLARAAQAHRAAGPAGHSNARCAASASVPMRSRPSAGCIRRLPTPRDRSQRSTSAHTAQVAHSSTPKTQLPTHCHREQRASFMYTSMPQSARAVYHARQRNWHDGAPYS